MPRPRVAALGLNPSSTVPHTALLCSRAPGGYPSPNVIPAPTQGKVLTPASIPHANSMGGGGHEPGERLREAHSMGSPPNCNPQRLGLGSRSGLRSLGDEHRQVSPGEDKSQISALCHPSARCQGPSLLPEALWEAVTAGTLRLPSRAWPHSSSCTSQYVHRFNQESHSATMSSSDSTHLAPTVCQASSQFLGCGGHTERHVPCMPGADFRLS